MTATDAWIEEASVTLEEVLRLLSVAPHERTPAWELRRLEYVKFIPQVLSDAPKRGEK